MMNNVNTMIGLLQTAQTIMTSAASASAGA